MEHKQVVTLTALLMLLAWSVVMTAIGHVTAIAPLAPILVLTVLKVSHSPMNRPLLMRHRAPCHGKGEDDAP